MAGGVRGRTDGHHIHHIEAYLENSKYIVLLSEPAN